MLHLFQDVFVLNSWIKSSVGCAWQCHQGLQPLCVLRPEGASCGISAKMCKARYWSYAVRPSFSWLTSLRQALGCRVYTPNKRQQHGTPWCHLDLDAVDPFDLLAFWDMPHWRLLSVASENNRCAPWTPPVGSWDFDITGWMHSLALQWFGLNTLTPCRYWEVLPNGLLWRLYRLTPTVVYIERIR